MPIVSSLDAVVNVKGVSEATKQLQSMDQATKSNQGSFKGFLSSMLSSVSAISITNLAGDAFGFLKDQLGSVFQESIDAQSGLAQTNAVLKSTHDVSGETSQAILDMAGSLSHLTFYSDDAIQAGENILLTFTNIHQNVFPQATKTMLDFARGMHIDVSQAALQMGKALNDPVAGVSALQREGVKLTDSQKKLIAQMVATGNVSGAQKIILGELAKEFGGSADATKTFEGRQHILQQSIADVRQTIGDALLPILQNLMTFITTSVVPGIQRFANFLASPQFAQFATVIGGVVIGAIKGLITTIGTIISVGSNLVGFFQKNEVAGDLLKGVIVAITAVALGFAIAAIPALVTGFIAWAVAAGSAAIATIAATWPILAVAAIITLVVAAIILAVQHWGQIMSWIGGVVGAIGSWIGSQFSRLGSTARGIADSIGQAFSNLGSLVQGVWDGIVGAIKGAINSVISVINGFISGLNSIHIDIGSVHIGVHIPLIPYLDKGIENFVGGLAYVHKGEVLTYLPPGTNVTPANKVGSMGGDIHVHVTVENSLDGQRLSGALMPHVANQVRYHLGTHF